MTSKLFQMIFLAAFKRRENSKGNKANFSRSETWHHLEDQESLYAAAKSFQSCPTLCDSIDGSPLCSPVLGILQARTLEWVAISFSNAWKWKVKVKSLSRVWLFTIPWTVPTRLLHPWDFPGKSAGVGCHCLLRSLYEAVQFKLHWNYCLSYE